MSKSRGEARHLKSVPHVLERPSMYIDNEKREARKIIIMEDGAEVMTKVETDIPLGLERVIIEIIANAADHSYESRKNGVDPGPCHVMMDENTITVTNGGLSLPVFFDEKTNLWTPELCFGKLRSGTSFTQSRLGGGTNGYGSKLTNIFSTYFKVRVVDAERMILYEQVWTNNMTRSDPNIQLLTEFEQNSVSITFKLELPRFGYTEDVFPLHLEGLVRRHAIDASFTSKTPFIFNGTVLNYANIVNYGKLIFPELNRVRYLVHTEESKIPGDLPAIELLLVDTPSKGRSIGLANSVLNQDGGKHVDAAYLAATEKLIGKLNKDSDTVKLNQRDVKTLLGVVVSVRIENPGWNSQSKTKLQSPTMRINLGWAETESIEKWTLAERIRQTLSAKKKTLLVASDGRNVRFIGDVKADDASEAGPETGKFCTLLILEGESAKNYGLIMCGISPYGRRRLGLFPLRGKLPNAYKATIESLAANKEIETIKTLLGIREGVDYSLEANFAQLRYGRVMILTDADKDGSHIKGLILALFNKLWPSILEKEYFQDYRTPILRAYIGKNPPMAFYSDREFEDWVSRTSDWEKYKIKYYKGLGNSSKEDVIQDYKRNNYVDLFRDAEANDYFELAFGKGKAASGFRRDWLANYDPDAPPLPVQGRVYPISNFFKEEFIKYGIYCLDRHIPGPDGLNLSMRKSIFGAFLQWGKKMVRDSETKMTTFVNIVSQESCYHHGDALSKVVTRMCMDFVGFNMPYFSCHGLYGTRDAGGKDASAPRYLTIRPNSWFLRLIFRYEDFPILPVQKEEGREIEPKFYLPVIPLHILQGSTGIGFGWKSFWPCFNMLDLIEYYINRCQEHRPPIPNPHYRGFTGDIRVVDQRQAASSSSSEPEPEPEVEPEPEAKKIKPLVTPSSKYTMTTTGVIKKDKTKTLVTELPIGLWTKTFRKHIIKLRKAGTISSYVDLSDDTKVHFEIKGRATVEDLNIVRHFSLTNLVLLDNLSRPQKFNTLEEAFDHFYNWRLPYYSERKVHTLKVLNSEIEEINNKLRYIQAIHEGRLVLSDNGAARDTKDVKADILALGLNPDYYKLPQNITSKNKITKFRQEIAKLEGLRDNLLSLTPQELWISDLRELRSEYLKQYGDDRIIG